MTTSTPATTTSVAKKTIKTDSSMGKKKRASVASKKKATTVNNNNNSDKKGNKKRSKKRIESYSTYIYRVLKQVHPDMRISQKSMTVMNDFISDVFDRLASQAKELQEHSKRPTLNPRDFEMAVGLALPGELAKHGRSEGTKALTTYTATKHSS
ncbi:hypothetical protein ACA910_007740 [Epithemia clementina (nom. ined.)]